MALVNVSKKLPNNTLRQLNFMKWLLVFLRIKQQVILWSRAIKPK